MTFVLLWALISLVLLGWATMRAESLLVRGSQAALANIGPATRMLQPYERQALTARFNLAFPSLTQVFTVSGFLRVRGWKEPYFLLDDLIIGLPPQLYSCASGHDRYEVVINPHQGAPHAFVISMSGISLLCECEAQQAGITLPLVSGGWKYDRCEFFPASGAVEARQKGLVS